MTTIEDDAWRATVSELNAEVHYFVGLAGAERLAAAPLIARAQSLLDKYKGAAPRDDETQISAERVDTLNSVIARMAELAREFRELRNKGGN